MDIDPPRDANKLVAICSVKTAHAWHLSGRSFLDSIQGQAFTQTTDPTDTPSTLERAASACAVRQEVGCRVGAHTLNAAP